MKNLNLLKICLGGILLSFGTFSSLKAEEDYLDKIKFQPIEKEKITVALEFLSLAIKANYEQIKTWQADVNAHTEAVYSDSNYIEDVFREVIKYKGAPPQKTRRKSDRKINIIIDTQKEHIYERSVRQGPVRYYDAKDNNAIAAVTGPFDQSYIVTPTYYIDCMDVKKKGDEIAGYRAIKRKVRNQRETIMKYSIFDPRQMIYTVNPIWNHLDTWRRKLQENNGDLKVGPYSGKFEKGIDESYIVYHLLLPTKAAEEEYVFLNLFFSEKDGWNMVKLEMMTQDFKVRGRMRAEYDSINEVYVPKRITKYNFNEDKSLARVEDYTFTQQSLNKDIDKDKFTYKNLGLKNGDKFIDKITDKEYKYEDANLVFVKDLPNPAKGKQ